MPISISEPMTITCPACGQPFIADVWVLFDAAERPDLAQALRAGTLDRVTCPHCNTASTASAPLLFHEPAQRRVYFAVPPNMDEYRWRERAQELLQTLLSNVPEEHQHPYFGDVQVEQEVGGVQRAVLRRDKRDRARRSSGGAQDNAPVLSPVDQMREQLVRQTEQGPGVRSQGSEVKGQRPRIVAPADVPATSTTHDTADDEQQTTDNERLTNVLFEAIQELLAADTSEQFRAVVAAHPVLLDETADAMFAQLANVAYDEGDRALADALHAARRSLQRMRRADLSDSVTMGINVVPVAAEQSQEDQDARSPLQHGIDALLRATTIAELTQALNDYPLLLTIEADAELVARVELALEEGNERLAQRIEDHREALIELRAATPADSPIIQAIEALLTAEDEATMERVIATYPVLLSNAAQEQLSHIIASAQAQGDTTLAEYAAECQTMLRNAHHV